MSLAFVKYFIEATELVISQVLQEIPRRGRVLIYEEQHQVPIAHLNVIIGVTGELSGQVAYGMSLQTAHGIAARMLGKPLSGLDVIGESAIGELANMIAGNALTLLTREGFETQMTHPSMLKGASMQMVVQKAQNVLAPFSLSQGELKMLVGLISERN